MSTHKNVSHSKEESLYIKFGEDENFYETINPKMGVVNIKLHHFKN